MPRNPPRQTGAGNNPANDGVDTCECRSGPVFGSALVDGATFRGKWLHYAEVDGQAMFEGDIVLGSLAELASDEGGNPVLQSIGLTGQQFRWPQGRIPFEIDAGLANPQRVTDAIAHWEANTPIRFVARTAANAAQHPNFVAFMPGNGCSSQVGMRGNRQVITLGTSCTTGNAIHEIGHAVGLWHEQSREDRDNFVGIVFANIDPSMQHNFNQHVSDGDDLGAYDFGSIMHYPATAFSTNGQATIVPRQPLPAGVVMGQRTGLSAGDIAGVRAMYPGLGPTVKETAKDPIRDPVTIKEIRKDPVRDPITIKEIRKDPIQDPITIKEIRKDPIRDPITIKEGAFDPGPFPRPDLPRPGSFLQGTDMGMAPFVLASPSRYQAQDPLAQAAEQIQRLAEAHTQAQAQADELAMAYEQAVQDMALLQGQGGV